MRYAPVGGCEAKWRACPERSRRGPAVSFCPSNLTAPNKSHRPPLCHPEQTTCLKQVEREMTLQNRRWCEARRAGRQTSAQPGTRISCHAALDEATYAAFFKESRMRFTEIAKSDRKSGGSRGTCSSTFSQAKSQGTRRYLVEIPELATNLSSPLPRRAVGPSVVELRFLFN